MAGIDNIALANKKNLVGQSKLISELNRINREKKTVLRLMNNEKQRFKNKYSKLDVITEHRGTEPSDVVMYETHNPGFCYRRNGECRVPIQCPIKNTTVGFEDIHLLIFTDGELDLEKVLCLHLLSTHRTETLTPPPKTQRAMMFIARLQSPLERLIERTKRRWPEDRLTRLLPIYVIDYDHQDKSDHLISDGRLAARLIVNEKLYTLVRSIMAALDKSNKEMLAELIRRSRNPEYLRKMVCKSKLQEFVKNLNGPNVISCCESFCITLPFRIIPNILEIDTPSGQLENFVYQIRKNIFKLPMNCSWDDEFTKTDCTSVTTGDSRTTIDDASQRETEIVSLALTTPDETWSKRVTSSFDADREDMLIEGRGISPTSPRPVIYSRKRFDSFDTPTHTPTVQTRKIQDRTLNLEQIRGMDFEKLATLLCKKANHARKKDWEAFERGEVDDIKPQRTAPSESSISSAPAPEPEPHPVANTKVSLRQLKCAACCLKWKQPLPVPKTSRIRRPYTSSTERVIEPDIQSRSSHLISSLIDQELKFWNDYKVSKNDSSFCSPRYGMSPRSSFANNGVIEIIDLDELDLAKVRQKIREQETKKKLEHFMKG